MALHSLDEYGFVAEFYDFVTPYKTRQDVAFYLQEAEKAGGNVLEVGSGTGRVMIPVARAGFSITGLEQSSAMLETCRAKVALEPLEVQNRIQLLKADMRHFDLKARFSLITVPFRPFQHLLTVADQVQCLRTLHRHLEPNGRLILDLFNPSLERLVAEEFGYEFGDEPEFSMPDGRKVRRSHRLVGIDRFAQISQIELIYRVTHPDGQEEELVHAFPMRYLFRYEAEHLLARCGFLVEELYADYDRSAFGSKYPGELIFIARAV